MPLRLLAIMGYFLITYVILILFMMSVRLSYILSMADFVGNELLDHLARPRKHSQEPWVPIAFGAVLIPMELLIMFGLSLRWQPTSMTSVT